jgi:hypothetical protein
MIRKLLLLVALAPASCDRSVVKYDPDKGTTWNGMTNEELSEGGTYKDWVEEGK